MVSLQSFKLQKLEERLHELSLNNQNYKPINNVGSCSGDKNQSFPAKNHGVSAKNHGVPAKNRSFIAKNKLFKSFQITTKKKKLKKVRKNVKNINKNNDKISIQNPYSESTLYTDPLPTDFKNIDLPWLAKNNLDWRLFVGPNRIEPVSETYIDRIVQLHKLQGNSIEFESEQGMKGCKSLFRRSDHITRRSIYDDKKRKSHSKNKGNKNNKTNNNDNNNNIINNKNKISNNNNYSINNGSTKKKKNKHMRRLSAADNLFEETDKLVNTIFQNLTKFLRNL
ncbi:hypothetical protein HELRODRAFT_173637 [Helobdella robusta]|uniref:Uncharacterized protein n=1 Tax=Helobdella robusta TaxID=6412 RepID=T1F728_HELRO|nr:hypothetical protein HELRODRAFT_173637 [Helobdella robusta]ESO03347.1 hypothetical protein HELRODRAFT_173637 [Helobdella robusta]